MRKVLDDQSCGVGSNGGGDLRSDGVSKRCANDCY
jgi:hypothetical protein